MVGSEIVKLEGYIMLESTGSDGEAEIGSSNIRLYGNGYVNIERSPLGEALGAYGGFGRGSFNGVSVGQVDGRLSIFPLGYPHVVDGGTEIGSYNGRSD